MQTLQDSGPRGTILCSVRTTPEGKRYAEVQGIGYRYEPRLGPDLEIPDMTNKEIEGWRCTVRRPFRMKGASVGASSIEPEFLVDVKLFPEAKK